MIYLIMIPIFIFGSGLWLVLRDLIRPMSLMLNLVIISVFSLLMWYGLISVIGKSNHLIGMVAVITAVGMLLILRAIEPIAYVLEFFTRRLERPRGHVLRVSGLYLGFYCLLVVLAIHRGVVFLPKTLGLYGRTRLRHSRKQALDLIDGLIPNRIWASGDHLDPVNLKQCNIPELRALTAVNLVFSKTLDSDWAVLDNDTFLYVLYLSLLCNRNKWLKLFFAFKPDRS